MNAVDSACAEYRLGAFYAVSGQHQFGSVEKGSRKVGWSSDELL